MSVPETEDESDESSQDSSGPRLSVWAPILLTAVAIGGLIWWIQSDDGGTARRTTAAVPTVTTDLVLPGTPTAEAPAGTGETEVAVAPAAMTAPSETAPAEMPAGGATPTVTTAPAPTAPAVTPAIDVPLVVVSPPAPAEASAPAEAPPPAAPPATEVQPPPAEMAAAPTQPEAMTVSPAETAAPTSAVADAETADVPASSTVSPAEAPPTVSSSDALSVTAQEPELLPPAGGVPVAAVSDVPAAARVEAGVIESARVTGPPPTLPTRPAPRPESVGALTAAAASGTALPESAIATRSGPPADPVPTVRVTTPAEIAAGPPVVAAEPGVAVLPLHRMPIVQPSGASDDGDLRTTEVAAGAEAVVKPEEVVAAESVAPVTIAGDSAGAPTVQVQGPQAPIGTIDPAAPVLAEASRATNAGSAPPPAPADVSPGTPNVGDAKATDAGVIVAETLDPATLGIIEPPDARDPPPTDAGDTAGAATGAADDPQHAIVAEDVDPAVLGAALDDPGADGPSADGPGADGRHGDGPVVAEDVDPATLGAVAGDSGADDHGGTVAGARAPIVAQEVDPASLGLSVGEADAADETVVAAAAPAAPAASIVAETVDPSALVAPAASPTSADAGALPMVAAVAAIEPPRPAWQRFATPVVDAAAGRPTVSVVIDGLGQSLSRTRMAIDMLPQAVALAFDPYAPSIADLAAAARAGGHEVLLTLPMEPASDPGGDAGPQALGIGQTAEELGDRLEWVLARARGYVGVLTPPDSALAEDPARMAPIVESLRRQGLMVVAADAAATGAGVPADLPQAKIDQRIDLPDDTGLYASAFAEAEETARNGGRVVLMVSPYPAALQGVAAWLATLPSKGLALAPVTAAATGSQAAASP